MSQYEMESIVKLNQYKIIEQKKTSDDQFDDEDATGKDDDSGTTEDSQGDTTDTDWEF